MQKTDRRAVAGLRFHYKKENKRKLFVQDMERLSVSVTDNFLFSTIVEKKLKLSCKYIDIVYFS